MKKLVATLAAVVVCGSLFADGKQVTWKGGGDTLRWSDGSNWVGGVAPEKGDIAVIPEDTTAWASHHSAANGGDMTLINSLAGICLNGTNACSEIDYEKDESPNTCCFDITVPLSGTGKFVLKNGINNDRYAILKADNSAFAGTFAFLDCRVFIDNLKALGTVGNRIEAAPSGGYHGIYYRKSGVYSNDVYVLRSSGIGLIGGEKREVCVTNLGRIVNQSAGQFALGNMYYYSISNAVANPVTDRDTIRIGGGAVIGAGGLYGGFRSRGQGSVITVAGPLRACGNKYNPAYLNQDGATTLRCGARDVLKGAFLQLGVTTLDLNGFDQAGVALCGPNSSVTITSDKPATMEWTDSNTTDPQKPNWSVSGKVTLIHNYGWDNKQYTYDSGSASTKGGFVVQRGKLTINPGYALPNVKWVGSTSVSSSAKSWLIVNTDAINPGRVDLVSSSGWGIIEIADGVQLDVRTFKSAGKYVKEGVYGSAAAQEAGTVDADHVLPCLAGLGTVKVELDGPPGLMLLVK